MGQGQSNCERRSVFPLFNGYMQLPKELSGPHAMLGDVDIAHSKFLWAPTCIISHNLKRHRKQAVITGCFQACCCLCVAVSHVMSVVLTKQSLSHPVVQEKSCFLRQFTLALKPHMLPLPSFLPEASVQ